ncbi:MAG: hypothetical protein U0Q19_00735 [Kineosporiaceae bacterium]
MPLPTLDRLPRLDRPVRRLTQLYLGLFLFGASMAFFVRARLGVMPWDVLHQGIVRMLDRFGVHTTLGRMTVAVGIAVLLLWIPLRQRPGLGTISNALVIGVVVDLVLPWVPQPDVLAIRIGYVVFALLLNAVASGAYIGARLGPGPRDGLMTGLCARTGWPVRWVRMAIEVTVVATGWLMGGNFGPGTILYALGIGPLVHPLLPRLSVAPATAPTPSAEDDTARTNSAFSDNNAR